MQTIYERLRLDKHLTAKGLAEALSIDRNKIYRIETGQTPDGETLKAYSKYFGVSTDYLLGLSKAKTQKEDLKMISDYTGLDVTTIELLHDYSEMDEFYIKAIYQTIQYLLDPHNELLHAIAMYLFYPDVDGFMANDEDGKLSILHFIDHDKIALTLKGTNHNLQFSTKDFTDIVLLDEIKKILQKTKSEKEGEINGTETNTARKWSRKRM